MSHDKDLKDQEIMVYVVLAIVSLWVIFSLGALVVVIAAITIIVLNFFKANSMTAFAIEPSAKAA